MAASGTAPLSTPWSALARARVVRASSREAAAGRAHRAARLLAESRPEASLDGGAEAALGRIRETRRPGAVAPVVRSEAQVLGHAGPVDDRAGAEQTAGVEGVLERDHRVVQTGPQDAGQQPAARAPAAVLARDRAVIRGHQVAHRDRELLHRRHPGRGPEIEQRPHVQAARRGVTGEGGARAVRAHQRLELGHELGQALGRDGGVLDEGRRAFGAGRAHEQRQHGAAQGRRLRERRRRLQPLDPGRAELGGHGAQAAQPCARLVLRALVLDRQHRALRAGHQRRHARVGLEIRRRAKRFEVEQLDRRRAGLEDRDVGLQRLRAASRT